ncbi:MAG: FtsW/RodA/SpoVE family cell cycle protein, partial [Deltaproteobacteria bacterium]|nr:FtsW/RodA/SpoVE family cell cycle protein [Deltaproteobacteria bacterium]
MFIDRRWLSQFDWILLGLCYLIPVLGLVTLYSAGYDAESSGFSLSWIPLAIRSQTFVKQLLFLSLGTVALLAALCLHPQRLARYAYALYAVCLLLLIGVLLFGVQAHGARRWLEFSGVRFQPSEFMKLC